MKIKVNVLRSQLGDFLNGFLFDRKSFSEYTKEESLEAYIYIEETILNLKAAGIIKWGRMNRYGYMPFIMTHLVNAIKGISINP